MAMNRRYKKNRPCKSMLLVLPILQHRKYNEVTPQKLSKLLKLRHEYSSLHVLGRLASIGIVKNHWFTTDGKHKRCYRLVKE